MKTSITVIIPALNEEGAIKAVVIDTLKALKDRFESYEIIIFDDGSTDATGKIADQLARDSGTVRVIHHERTMGLGFSVRSGYDVATKEYVMWVPGDHGMKSDSLDVMFDSLDGSDIVIPYIANPEFRSKKRQLVSQAYVSILNLAFGLKLRYYNGPLIYRTSIIQNITTTMLGFGFFSEALILSLKNGASYVEVPTFHQRRAHGSSKAFSLKNLVEISMSMCKLLWKVKFKSPPRTKSLETSTAGRK
jgi:dolichol-phosphate mannosyltransferase